MNAFRTRWNKGRNSSLMRVLLFTENVIIVLDQYCIKLHCYMHHFMMDRAIPAVQMWPLRHREDEFWTNCADSRLF